MPKSSDVDQAVSALGDMLKDEFSKKLLMSSLQVLNQTENDLRMSFFALGIRELFTHTLHTLAPGDEVVECVWYKPQTDDGRPTRRQRAFYATHGGISFEKIKELGLNCSEIHSDCVRQIEYLNRATHVRPTTIVSSDDVIADRAAACLSALQSLLQAIVDTRKQIEAAIIDHIHQHAFEKLTEETIEELSELSSHTLVDGPAIYEINIVNIGSKVIDYEIRGEVNVTLNYGSSSDFRKGEGASVEDSYPFKMTSSASTTKLTDFAKGQLTVDNSSFYK